MKIKEYKKEGGIFVRTVTNHYGRSVAYINKEAKKLKEKYPFLTDEDIEIVEGDPRREARMIILGAFIEDERLKQQNKD